MPPVEKPIVYKPLKWLEGAGSTNPIVNQAVYRPYRLYRQPLQVIASLEARERTRQFIFDKHDSLLSGNENKSWDEQSSEFREFYSQNQSSFDEIHRLRDEYLSTAKSCEAAQLELSLTIPDRIKHAAARKEGFFSNIKFHMDEAGRKTHPLYKNESPIRSLAIAVLSTLGIAVMILGGILLVPTIHTILLPLPLAYIALGALLTAAGLIVAYIDQQEALKMHPILEQSIGPLEQKKNQYNSYLSAAREKIDAIEFALSDQSTDEEIRSAAFKA